MVRLNSSVSITSASEGVTTMLASLSSAFIFQHAYAMQGAVFLGSGSANIWLFNTIGSCSLTMSTYFCEVTTQIFSLGQISLNLSAVSWMRDFPTPITSMNCLG